LTLTISASEVKFVATFNPADVLAKRPFAAVKVPLIAGAHSEVAVYAEIQLRIFGDAMIMPASAKPMLALALEPTRLLFHPNQVLTSVSAVP